MLAGERLAPELTAADLLVPAATPELARTEAEWVRRLNAEEAGAIRRLAVVGTGRAQAAWRVTGIDPEGIDLRYGAEAARVRWHGRIARGEDALAAIRTMVRETPS